MSICEIESDLEVKTYDIDIAGHVNNIVYVRWLEDLRSKILESRYPVSELLKVNLYPVVTETRIRYKNQLKLGDMPTGTIWIESIRHGVMNLKIIFRKGDVVIATAEQSCVLMNLKTGKMDGSAMEAYL